MLKLILIILVVAWLILLLILLIALRKNKEKKGEVKMDNTNYTQQNTVSYNPQYNAEVMNDAMTNYDYEERTSHDMQMLILAINRLESELASISLSLHIIRIPVVIALAGLVVLILALIFSALIGGRLF